MSLCDTRYGKYQQFFLKSYSLQCVYTQQVEMICCLLHITKYHQANFIKWKIFPSFSSCNGEHCIILVASTYMKLNIVHVCVSTNYEYMLLECCWTDFRDLINMAFCLFYSSSSNDDVTQTLQLVCSSFSCGAFTQLLHVNMLFTLAWRLHKYHTAFWISFS